MALERLALDKLLGEERPTVRIVNLVDRTDVVGAEGRSGLGFA